MRALEQVDLGQPAVATEDVGIARVARIHHRGVRQVAQAADTGIGLAGRGVHQRDMAAGALDHQPEVAGAAHRRRAAAPAGRAAAIAASFGKALHQAWPRSIALRPRRESGARAASACPAGHGRWSRPDPPPACRPGVAGSSAGTEPALQGHAVAGAAILAHQVDQFLLSRRDWARPPPAIADQARDRNPAQPSALFDMDHTLHFLVRATAVGMCARALKRSLPAFPGKQCAPIQGRFQRETDRMTGAPFVD
jgi:hypothetical protein